MTDSVLEPSWTPPRHRLQRPSALPSPLFPEGSVRTTWQGSATRTVTLGQQAVESLVTVLRRGNPTECHRAWRAFLHAIGDADVDRPGTQRRNGHGKGG